MPHWINLSYYGSSRQQARAGGKRYRPRLIPPAGLKVERRRTFVDAGHMPRLDTFTDVRRRRYTHGSVRTRVLRRRRVLLSSSLGIFQLFSHSPRLVAQLIAL